MSVCDSYDSATVNAEDLFLAAAIMTFVDIIVTFQTKCVLSFVVKLFLPLLRIISTQCLSFRV